MAIYALCVLEPLWLFMHFVCLSLCGLYALCVLEPLWLFMHFVCFSLCAFRPLPPFTAVSVLEPLWSFMHFVCCSLWGPLSALCAWAFVALYALCVLEPLCLFWPLPPFTALCVLEPLWPFTRFVCLSSR